jgi:hypothetical protein
MKSPKATLSRFLDFYRIRRLPTDKSPIQTMAPPEFVAPGHYYSPIPSLEDIEHLKAGGVDSWSVPGVDLNEEAQLSLLEEFARFYGDIPFTATGSPGLRYRFDNESYSYADGILFYAMLRYLRPRRIIEVGSGYTSALALDVNDRFLDGQTDHWFIEPYPDLLFSLITEADRRRSRIVQARLQDVGLETFKTLGPGDVLFIDSTHVAKVNSDVTYLFFEILPNLAAGVMVHLHDVFPGFEYPIEWLRQGRAWNEQYVLRAFLQFNDTFRVRLFGSYMIRRYADWFSSRMPLCLRNPGGAFWMEKVR